MTRGDALVVEAHLRKAREALEAATRAAESFGARVHLLAELARLRDASWQVQSTLALERDAA